MGGEDVLEYNASSLFFFFFQAEDGIRDHCVTGVQTCALPISQASVDVIIEGMAWLQLDHDEGPFYQMQRMDRYKEVLAGLQASGHVYPCYMSVEELDALRERQMANKEKPRYDGTWRPEEGKVLPPVPEGVRPVLRFKTPQ